MRLCHRGFPVNFERFLGTSFIQNTSGWLLPFYNGFWLYSSELYIAGNFQILQSHWSGKNSCICFKDFADLGFFYYSFSFTNVCLHCHLRKAYAILWAANRFVGSETPKYNDFEQFWKFKFHFEHLPRNTWFFSFDGSSNNLYLFK